MGGWPRYGGIGVAGILSRFEGFSKKFELGTIGIQFPAAVGGSWGRGARVGWSTGSGTPPVPATEQAAPATEVAGVAVQEVVPKPPEGGTGEGAKKQDLVRLADAEKCEV